MNIRKLMPNDCEAIYKIECNSFSVPWSMDSIQKEIENPLAYYLVAEEDEVIVGYAGMWEVMGEGQITNVAVDKDYRNKGIGMALLEQLVEDARKHNLEVLVLEVRTSNAGAINLYTKAGFKESGIRKNYYNKPKEDAMLMQFIL